MVKSSEIEVNISGIDLRVRNLSAEKQAMFTESQQARRRFSLENQGRGTLFIGELPADEDEKWNNLILACLEEPQPNLAQFAAKEGVFDADRFKFSMIFSSEGATYDSRAPYTLRGSDIQVGDMDKFYSDGPVTFALLYKRNDDTWEPISSISLAADFKHDAILVNHLQAGATEGQTTEEGIEARKQFKKRPKDQILERILYAHVIDIAKRGGIHNVALRKPESSIWPSLKAAKEEGRRTIYDKLADDRRMIEAPFSDDYYMDYLRG